MIPTGEEIVSALKGGWRIFLGRPEGLRDFDISEAGFWRSFTVIIVCLPLLYPAWLVGWSGLAQEAGGSAPVIGRGGFFAVMGLAWLVDWVVFPVVVGLLAGTLGIGRRYAGFIIVRNWSVLLMLLPVAAVSLLFLFGLLGSGGLNFLTLILIGVAIRLNYLVARLALNADWPLAVGLVALENLMSLAIRFSAERLFLS